MVASLKFFLGSDPDEKGSDDSDSDNEPDLKSAMLANRVNKKTKKRQKQLANVKKQITKVKKKKTAVASFNFSAVHLIHNPQGMAENLFKQLQGQNERFEVKLMHLDVISRLIGIHDLFLFSFYPYITRFLQPHQRQVTRILQFAAQASHELVPGEVVEPVLKTIANNFITERNSTDVMAIGLNAVRAICSRCPLAMGEDLLRDLVLYKSYKEKSVMMAARSLITLYREQIPALLHKKDRGRTSEAQAEMQPKQYGATVAFDNVPGAEVLLKSAKSVEVRDEDDSDSDSDSWVDVNESGDEINISDSDDESDDNDGGSDVEEEEGDVEDDDEEGGDDDEEVDSDDDDEDEESENDEDESASEDEDIQVEPPKKKIEQSKKKTIQQKSPKVAKNKKSKASLNGSTTSIASTTTTDENGTESSAKVLDEKQAAQEIAYTRIFTDEDFKRIDAQIIKKHVSNARKRPLETEQTEYVKLDDIEMIYKKRRTDKASRMETVMKGREDREKYGYRDKRKNIHCSKTNTEKQKKKNFGMMRQKARSKVKKSFKDKQQAMRKHLLKQKKMK